MEIKPDIGINSILKTSENSFRRKIKVFCELNVHKIYKEVIERS